jgi:hypothetical protein
MTMSLHKLTAGTGYTYLTRQVAAHDGTPGPRASLASYYAERGETPGRWVGSGVAGIEGLGVGDEVTAEQMRLLFGFGLHPLADQREELLQGPGLTARDYRAVRRLGVPYKVYNTEATAFQVQVAQRIEDHNASLGHQRDYPVAASDRARIRSQVATEMFRAEHGRDPRDARELSGTIAKHSRPRTTAVGGYDLTFSPVKSVSTLWAIAPPQVAAQVELAHNEAVADALAFIEQHALYTREGTNGVPCPGSGCPSTSRASDQSARCDLGLEQDPPAAAFTHRDSRDQAGDVDLAVGVQVRIPGAGAGALGEDQPEPGPQVRLHRLRDLQHRLGLHLVRDGDVVGVDPALNGRWSSRRASVEARRGELATAFQGDHGRPPTVVEAILLAQQATLETRDAKHEPRTLTEQRAAWRDQAEEVLGGPDGVSLMLATALSARCAGPASVDAAWVRDTATRVRDEIQSRRSTWQVWHVRAEAHRQVRAANLPAEHVDAIVDLVTDHTLTATSVRLTPTSDGIEEPPELRRMDGSSVYEVAGSAIFTSTQILAAEQRLVDAAGVTDRHRATPEAADLALLEQAANGTTLNPGQAALVTQMATSGARLQLAIAPAGAGKTTAMRALAAAWVEDGGTVIGLAPSAAAAAVLREETGAATDTLAKLTWSIQHDDLPKWVSSIGPHTLVVIDEAGMADTLSLDTAVTFVTAHGGQVRLIGDNQQLAAIGPGGALRDIAATHGALHLTELMRFTDPVEGNASLALRDGHTVALGYYLDHDRVHVGDLATLTTDVFTAWAADRARGLDALMLAPTRDLVSQLNQQAQHHRLAGRDPGPGVRLADGNTASIGDTVVTRTNDRRLRLGPNDWVKNGDRWTVQQVHPSGSIHLQHNRSGRLVNLPADYVAEAAQLGYASTIHGAQGITADTAHALATGDETRQQLYTMLTRGADANHLYLKVVGDGDPHDILQPQNVRPATATDLLEDILARDDAATSATTAAREHVSPSARLGAATARYLDALHVAAEHHLGQPAINRLENGAERIIPGIADDSAWPTLRAHLILLAATSTDPLTALHVAASSRELNSADDRAAVLDWRLGDPGTTGTGPLPWLPGIPQQLRDDPQWGAYLTARSELVTTLATAVRHQARSTSESPPWWTPGRSVPAPDLLGDLAVWRAANAIPDSDHRPTGPAQPAKAHALWQHDLDARVGSSGPPTLADWTNLVHALFPATRRDDYTPQLAGHLAELRGTGVDAEALLHTATGAPLPDDHAASALWWRITRHLPAPDHDATHVPEAFQTAEVREQSHGAALDRRATPERPQRPKPVIGR